MVKREKVLCREIYCVYELDGHEQWHSLHNNRVRIPKEVAETSKGQFPPRPPRTSPTPRDFEWVIEPARPLFCLCDTNQPISRDVLRA